MRRSLRQMLVLTCCLLPDWVLLIIIRCTTISNVMATGIAISSSTQRTGTWPHALRQTVYTGSHMAIFQALPKRNILLDNRNDGRRSYLAIPRRISTPSRTSIHISCSRGVRRVSVLDGSFLRRTLRICVIHCE